MMIMQFCERITMTQRHIVSVIDINVNSILYRLKEEDTIQMQSECTTVTALINSLENRISS